MANQIIFEGDTITAQRQIPPGGLSGRLVAWGIAKNERSAGYILLGIAVLCILVAAVLLMQSASSGNSFGNYDAMKAAHPELFQNEPMPTR